MNLFPVSERSTRNAVRQVVGGKVTNKALWRRHLHEVSERQPALWAGLELAAGFRTRIARIARPELGFQEDSYAGGALIFLAAVESQARYIGTVLGTLSDEAFISWWKTAALEGLSEGDQADVNAAIYNTTRDEDLGWVEKTPLRELNARYEQVIANNADAFASSPFFEQSAALLGKLATVSFDNTATAAAGFLNDEPHFAAFMQGWWWNDTPPPVTISQQVGACDMRNLLRSAGVQ